MKKINKLNMENLQNFFISNPNLGTVLVLVGFAILLGSMAYAATRKKSNPSEDSVIAPDDSILPIEPKHLGVVEEPVEVTEVAVEEVTPEVVEKPKRKYTKRNTSTKKTSKK